MKNSIFTILFLFSCSFLWGQNTEYSSKNNENKDSILLKKPILHLSIAEWEEGKSTIERYFNIEDFMNDSIRIWEEQKSLFNQYFNEKDYENALVQADKNLRYSEQYLNETKYYPVALNNVGLSHKMLRHHSKAKGYYKKAIKFSKQGKTKNVFGYPIFLFNLAALYDFEGKYRKSIRFYKKMLKSFYVSYSFENTALIEMIFISISLKKYSSARKNTILLDNLQKNIYRNKFIYTLPDDFIKA